MPSLSANKIVLLGSNSGAPGGYFQNQSINVNVGANVTLPAGIYYLTTPTGVTINGNLTGAGNVVLMAAAVATPTLVMADGTNVWANATANATITLISVNSGEIAKGTWSGAPPFGGIIPAATGNAATGNAAPRALEHDTQPPEEAPPPDEHPTSNAHHGRHHSR